MDKPECKLIGEDGNVFYIIGKVKRTLIQHNQRSEADEFVKRAFSSGSYEEVLSICQDYVEIV